LDNAYRRRVGCWLGLGLALAFGLVATNVNRLTLPGVLFYQPPLGPWGNLVLLGTAGAALGLLSAWPENGVLGTFASASLGALLLVAFNMLAARGHGDRLWVFVVGNAFLVVPLAALCVPLLGLVRWTAGKQDEGRQMHLPAWRRLIRPLALALMAGTCGMLALYHADTRVALARLNSSLAQAQGAADLSALPAFLQSEDVGGFVEHARGRYTLQHESNNVDRFRIPRPSLNFDDQQAIIARFEAGWSLVCIYPTPDADPLCKGFAGLNP
jgi:hypothetical protein